MKPTIVGLVAVAACFGVFGGVSPASAQVDLSGMWAPIFHEDQIERAQVGQAAANSAQIIAHENVMKRMTEPEGNAKPATGLMPTDTFFTEENELYFNGEAVQILHQPDAHTDGDVIVFLRKSDVVVTGDVFNTQTFPVIDALGSLNGIVASLNHILDITVPKDKQEGGTYVIPGHGRLTDEADVVEYRDMMTIIRNRLADAVKKGRTLEQVKVEAAYQSLKENK
jgi:cyclase